MNSGHQILWNACSEAVDYFSRMGRSGRYSGFREFHVPALVIILALEKINPLCSQDDAVRKLLPERLWTETGDLLKTVKKIIDRITYSETGQLREFVEYVNSRYQEKAPDELVQWDIFVKELGELGWHI